MVTRANLAAERSAGLPQEGRLAALKSQREAGLTPDQTVIATAPSTMLNIAEAFNASTLMEAQEILATTSPSLASPMSLGGTFDNPTGASPVTTGALVLTVPVGNPGRLTIATSAVGAGTARILVNGSPGEIAVDGDNIQMRWTSAPESIFAYLYDATTGALLGLSQMTAT